ncbi:quinic acid utilization activator [Magnaporthiopsis poae ATCC 64411]|uniref:Quinic acid utilization activator n=1 Tax=Magnaporthiopsis poae (strain ATCC 64411 / 73-15) TaxID=644358 RepID=A0A0C4E4S7_MAGP6|nr:quinic acid utilization activator [Magnaporthiopsis poae ATCC 64411]
MRLTESPRIPNPRFKHSRRPSQPSQMSQIIPSDQNDNERGRSFASPVKGEGARDGPNRMLSKRKQASSTDDTASTITTAPVVASAPAKRQRVSRACDQCRAAREKCDGIQPLCFPCVSQNRKCTYQTSPKKRGVQTGYIRALEVALGWLFDKNPGCEDALNKLLAHEGGQAKALLVADAPGPGSRLHRRWLKSSACLELDRILSGGEPTRRDPAIVGSRDDDASGSDNEADTEARRSDAGKATTPAARPTPSSQGGDSPAPRLYPPPNHTRFRLPPNHWRLLDMYFSYTHCWFPIVEKQDILKTTYGYPEAGLDLSPTHPSAPTHAELWAILAFAACQASATAEPAVNPAEAYRTARQLMRDDNGPFETSHINALLLLSLVNLGSDNVVTAWMLAGNAVRIALSLGLGQIETHAALSEKHRRAFMGCFILDTLVSARTGWPQHLRSDILVGLSPPMDDIDEWQPWQPCQGIGPGAELQTRGIPLPAQALSSFRLLCDLCRALSASELPNMAAPTQIAIDSAYQHRSFVLAGTQPPSQIPSPYLLRLLFLVVQAKRHGVSLMAQTPPSALREAMSHVETYATQHGMATATPLFTTCLIVMRRCCIGSLASSLTGQDVSRLASLENALLNTWRRGNPPPAPAQSTTAILPERSAGPNKNRQGIPSRGPPHTPKVDGPMQEPPYYAPVYQHMFSHQDGPVQPVGIFGVGPMPPLMPPIVSLPHGGAIPAYNYDTLLDDLASSIDCTDRVDADSQFMANLGFAPGADLTDLLRGEFGGA